MKVILDDDEILIKRIPAKDKDDVYKFDWNALQLFDSEGNRVQLKQWHS